MTRVALALHGVTRRYSAAAGVFSIDLEVRKGESLCLLGPSGCGKTTLLRIIAGLLAPQEGTVLIDGQDLTRAPVHARDIGMVFQTWALFAHMSVLRNVEFGLAMRRVARTERRRRALEMLDLVGLAAFADRRPRSLSGGQQQRVALARALAISPRLLLLDEPLSSLDHNTRVELRQEVRRLQKTLGLTALLVTHDYSEALAIGDRTVLMQAGRIIEQGDTQALFNRPRTEYGARFLGLHNVVPARVTAHDAAGIAITIGDGHAARIPLHPDAPPPGQTALLCFDHWSADLADEPGPETLPATVADCIAEHGCTRIVVRLADGAAVSVLRPGLHAPTTGSGGALQIDWRRAWLLHPTSSI